MDVVCAVKKAFENSSSAIALRIREKKDDTNIDERSNMPESKRTVRKSGAHFQSGQLAVDVILNGQQKFLKRSIYLLTARKRALRGCK